MSRRRFDQGGWWRASLLALTILSAIAPTLSWPEFATGAENLTVATAMESARDGHWLMPRLMGEPRLHKPPLASWIAATVMSDELLRMLDHANPQVRAAAYEAMAFRVRMLALAACFVIALATFDIARSLRGRRAGLVAVPVVLTCFLVLRHGRSCNYDIFLACFVALANAATVRMLVGGASVGRFALLTVALAAAMLTKGPVALLQATVPAAVVLFASRSRLRGITLISATSLAVVAASVWFVIVAMRSPVPVWGRWTTELTRHHATGLPPGSPLQYLLIVPMMFPWTVLVFVGLADWWTRRHARRDARRLWPVVAMVAPLLLMALAGDRKERYMLPMAVPAAVLAASALVRFARPRTKGDRICMQIHHAAVAVVAIAFPILAASGLSAFQTASETPWLSPTVAAALAVVAAAVAIATYRLARRGPLVIAVGGAAVAVVLASIFSYGYSISREGRGELRPLAERIRAVDAAAVVHDLDNNRRPPEELGIYLNRPVTRGIPVKRDARVVYVATSRAGAAAPVPPGDGWTLLGVVPRDSSRWWAFVREPVR